MIQKVKPDAYFAEAILDTTEPALLKDKDTGENIPLIYS
jgi:hypothetical protein